MQEMTLALGDNYTHPTKMIRRIPTGEIFPRGHWHFVKIPNVKYRGKHNCCEENDA